MVFEPTFDEIGRRSAELATGGDPDAHVQISDTDMDVVDAPGDDQDGLAEAGLDGADAVGDVEADDLPPEGG